MNLFVFAFGVSFLSLSCFAQEKSSLSAHYQMTPQEQASLEGEPDLFKRYDQIFSASVEFLYWKTSEGALDYALTMQNGAWGDTPSFAQGNFQKACYDMDPGFRLGFLFFRAKRFWEIRWLYTRLTTRGKEHVSKPGEANLFLTGTFPQTSPFFLTGADSKVHLNYNTFDWVVDRVFFPNPHLRLRYLGGITVAWISQDWKVVYEDALKNTTAIRNRWNFTGAGLKNGATIDWYWTGNLYMTAQAFLGLLVGSYGNRAKQTTTYQPSVSDDTNRPIRNAKFSDTRSAVTGQVLLGPSYQKNTSCHRFEIFAGFETNVWFNLQEIYRSTQSSAFLAKETWMSTGLLSLYGLSIKASFDF